MKIEIRDKKIFIKIISGLILLLVFILILFFSFNTIDYKNNKSQAAVAEKTEEKIIPFVPHYISTPDPVKGIYMTSWVAGTPRLRNSLVKLADNTELNSIVIDVKDYSGRVSFKVSNPELKKFGSEEIRIADLPPFLESLHQKNIYTIARIAVFQDAFMVKSHPEWAVKNGDGTKVWKDRKGISWIDPGAREYWDYIVLVGKEAHAAGFDEINFDYIRFPSDGNMHDIYYPYSGNTARVEIMKQFFEYLHNNFKSTAPLGVASGIASGNDKVKISADLFGLVTVADDDMGIGQVLTDALSYFDYVCPMVYPSHYAVGFNNFKNPAEHPYDVVFKSMSSAVARANNMNATSTNPAVEVGTVPQAQGDKYQLHYRAKLRPWLQDFDLGADYNAPEVKAQIKATNDTGLDSWMLWSAANTYTAGALDNQ